MHTPPPGWDFGRTRNGRRKLNVLERRVGILLLQAFENYNRDDTWVWRVIDTAAGRTVSIGGIYPVPLADAVDAAETAANTMGAVNPQE